ncbi:MFS transporter [Mahella sp.]|uniref:MFS transporter n=1 Tax=Mahella sp. TaxID=2798721 RepID=UPI0025BB2E40|nr:MFS transporter [Mahella sp.]MBZ4665158.1 major facilitator superfamily 1 [Mahella sp.]
MKKSDYMQLPKRLSTLEAAYWSASACYYAYIVMYLSQRGYSNSSIGAIMSLTAVISIISPPIWGYVSDRTGAINKVMAACASLTAIAILILPSINQLWAITLIMALIAFTDSPNPPLLDSVVMQNMHRMSNTSYGSIRLWGSVGYAITAYLIGLFMEIYGTGIMFIAYSFFAIFIIKMVLSLPDPDVVIKSEDTASTKAHPSALSLFTNPNFVLFLIFGSLLFTPHKASFTFLPQLFSSIGGTSAQLGAAWFVSAASEAPILFLGQRLNTRYKPLHIILLSSVFFMARLVIYAFTYAPWLAILNQVLQGLSFGLFLTGTVYYINEIAPDGLKATAQTIATAAYMGISGILGSYLGGVIIDRYEIHAIYKVGIIVQAIAVAGFVLSNMILRHKNADI